MKARRPPPPKAAKRAPSIEALESSETYAYVTNKWSRTVVQPLLIALVMTAFLTAVAVVIDTILGDTWGVMLAPIYFLASLEGVYTTLWLEHPNRRQLNRAAYRAAEFLVILLILRLYTWIIAGSFPRFAGLADYLRYPYLLAADGFFIGGVLLTLLAWTRANALCRRYNDLAIDRAEAYFFTLPRGEQDAALKPSFSDRGAILAGLFSQWISGGILLTLCTAVITVRPFTYPLQQSLRSLSSLPLPPAMILSLLVYFVGGLLLLSQARLGALNARWLHEGVIKTPDVEHTWQRYTTWLLLAIAGAALFLPLGSTLAIGRVLDVVVSAVLAFFTLLSYLFVGLMGLFAAPLSEGLPAGTPQPQPTQAVPTPQPTPLPTSTAPPDETAQLMISSAFWAVAIVMTVVAVSFFLRDRGIRLNLRLFQMLGHSLATWVRGLWRDASEYAGDFRQSIRTRLSPKETEKEKGETPPWRFIRVNALPPREQIRYFYLSTVKRAGDRGVPRDQGETPLEFAEDLKTNWPEAEAEIEELTEAFLRARYSQEKIEKVDVHPVKKQWQQVKASLRRRMH